MKKSCDGFLLHVLKDLMCDACVFSGDAEMLERAVIQACNELLHSCDLLNALDSAVGDGDCGTTLANGARGKLFCTAGMPRFVGCIVLYTC